MFAHVHAARPQVAVRPLHRRAAPAQALGRPATRTRRVPSPLRAEPPKNDTDTSSTSSEQDARIKEISDQMRSQGVDRARARELLAMWEKQADSGSPEDIKKVLAKGALAPVVAFSTQLVIDAVVAVASFNAAVMLGQSDDFFGKWLLGGLAYGASFYYGAEALLSLFLLISTGISTYYFSTNADAYVKAVQSLAGGETGLGVVDRAKKAASAAKVVRMLNQMSAALRADSENAKAEAAQGAKRTLSNLSSYLLLADAQTKLGFRAEDYGLTQADAESIARVFVRYDKNSDLRLEVAELAVLAKELGHDMGREETETAIRVLDKNKNGYVEFDEFVQWWTKEVSPTGSMLASIDEAEAAGVSAGNTG
ncbi:unnamed protein product [Pedinophyceae sp. YPF-701]|nr:unnamed protein product [Pedinophyceae sp. YPF-701]